MYVYFIGICTHVLQTGGQPYRVLLPASNDFSVLDPASGPPIKIPNHLPLLIVPVGDIVDTQELGAFNGSDVTPVISLLPEVLAWQLSADSVFTIPSANGGMALNQSDECLPHLAFSTNVTLQPAINDGTASPDIVATTIALDGGSMQAMRDQANARLTRLHHVVTTDRWQLQVQSSSSTTPRTLTLRPDASIAFANVAGDGDCACSEFDYLLHYRVTNQSFVPLDDFTATNDCDLVTFDVGMFGLKVKKDVTTFNNCSNSIYP